MIASDRTSRNVRPEPGDQRVALLARALASLGEGVCMTRDDDVIVWVNERFCEIFGYGRGELVGRHISMLRPPDFERHLDREIRDGTLAEGYTGEVVNVTRDGREILVSLTTAAVRGDDGEPLALIGVVRDVTEQQRAAEAGRKRLEQLGAVNRIARLLTATLDPEKVITTAVRETQSRLGLHSVILVMMDRESGELGSQEAAGAYRDRLPADYHRRVWQGLIGHAARSGETVVVGDVLQDDRFVAACDGEKATRTEVCVPVQLSGEVLGVLDVQSTRPRAFDDIDVQTFETIADQIAVSTRSATLFAKAERDLSDRIRAQERLRASESRYRDLVESSGDLICTHDLDGVLLSVNFSALRVLGYTAGEMVGRCLADFMSEKRKPEFNRYLEEIAVSGRARGVLEVLGKTGDRVYWEYHNTVRSDTDPPIVRGVARDVTDRVVAERALRGERDRARQYLDLAGVLFVAVDEQGRVTLVNRKTCEILGRNEGDIVGRCWFDEFVPASHRADAQHAFDRLMSGEAHQYAESPVLTDAGVERLVAWRSTAVLDGQGRVIGMLASGEDVTERRLLEEQLRHAQRLEAMGRLAGGVAHDFNNLLQAMLVTAQMVRDEQDPSAMREAIAEIEENILRGSSLTRQLLLFARRGVTRPQRLDLNELVRTASSLLQRLVRENVVLSLRIGREPLPIRADRSQLEQVLTNLVVNATDAMPDGGDLEVATGGDAREVWFEVRDSGCGVPDELRGRIFDPFFTTKEATKGTGLGLAVAHGIVSEHRGRIELSAGRDPGACFRVTLPREPGGGSGARSQPREPGAGLPRGRGESILLVEDNDQIRVTFERMLVRLGYGVRVAASAAEVWGLPDEPGFDLLISDVVLPGEPGTEIARRMMARQPTLAVILMSGYAKNDVLVQEISSSDVCFLQKPVDLATLAREIRRVLDAGED